MWIKYKLHLRFRHLFISAAVATLNGVNRLRLKWLNAHNPTFATGAICTEKRDMRIVPELDSENLLSRKKCLVQFAALFDFVG